jgi:hypothetical protein
MRHYDPPEYEGDARPAVIIWYRIYAALTTLLSLGLLAFVVLLAKATTDPQVAVRAGAQEAHGEILLYLILVLANTIFFAVATFVPYKPWGWTIGLIAIGLGISSAMLVFAIPLMVYWLKPITKAAFGRL